MIDQHTIFEIHRLANEGLSIRKIANRVNINRKTVARYLYDPNPKR
ncbi:helix-turn-helix domain-containing protein, partial [bacterium]|nr:helix-turn-helix domain-containing protein [bacterium]